MKPDAHDSERLEVLTRRRLGRLATRPVDTSRLERRLEGLFEADAAGESPRWRLTRQWWRPATGVAAVIVLAVLVGLILSVGDSGPATASPMDVQRAHWELREGAGHVVPVSGMADARQAIAREWPDAPALPNVETGPVMACCVHWISGRPLASVLFHVNDVPVSLMVAHASDLRGADGTTVQYEGRAFVTHQMGSLTMVMTEQDGRWLCLTGELPQTTLLELAGRLL